MKTSDTAKKAIVLEKAKLSGARFIRIHRKYIVATYQDGQKKLFGPYDNVKKKYQEMMSIRREDRNDGFQESMLITNRALWLDYFLKKLMIFLFNTSLKLRKGE